MSKQETVPYVRDAVKCTYCSENAEYYCPSCKTIGKPVNVCSNHVLMKKGLPRCPVCKENKLYRIEARFVGSYEPMKKAIQGKQHKIWVKPKTLGPNEEKDRITRDEL